MFQCVAPSTDWLRIFGTNTSLEEVVLEQKQGIIFDKILEQLLANESSQLKVLDYTAVDWCVKLSSDRNERLWVNLDRLVSQKGRLSKVCHRNFSSRDAHELLTSPLEQLAWMKPFFSVGRSSAKFVWPHEKQAWE